MAGAGSSALVGVQAVELWACVRHETATNYIPVTIGPLVGVTPGPEHVSVVVRALRAGSRGSVFLRRSPRPPRHRVHAVSAAPFAARGATGAAGGAADGHDSTAALQRGNGGSASDSGNGRDGLPRGV